MLLKYWAFGSIPKMSDCQVVPLSSVTPASSTAVGIDLTLRMLSILHVVIQLLPLQGSMTLVIHGGSRGDTYLQTADYHSILWQWVPPAMSSTKHICIFMLSPLMIFRYRIVLLETSNLAAHLSFQVFETKEPH